MEQSIVRLISLTFTVLMVVWFLFWLVPSMLSFWLKCERCRIRIASLRAGSVSSIGPGRFERLGTDTIYSRKKICSHCWEQLEDKGFPSSETWGPGATAEYLKSTPNFLALFISIGALIVSIIALLG